MIRIVRVSLLSPARGLSVGWPAPRSVVLSDVGCRPGRIGGNRGARRGRRRGVAPGSGRRHRASVHGRDAAERRGFQGLAGEDVQGGRPRRARRRFDLVGPRSAGFRDRRPRSHDAPSAPGPSRRVRPDRVRALEVRPGHRRDRKILPGSPGFLSARGPAGVAQRVSAGPAVARDDDLRGARRRILLLGASPGGRRRAARAADVRASDRRVPSRRLDAQTEVGQPGWRRARQLRRPALHGPLVFRHHPRERLRHRLADETDQSLPGLRHRSDRAWWAPPPTTGTTSPTPTSASPARCRPAISRSSWTSTPRTTARPGPRPTPATNRASSGSAGRSSAAPPRFQGALSRTMPAPGHRLHAAVDVRLPIRRLRRRPHARDGARPRPEPPGPVSERLLDHDRGAVGRGAHAVGGAHAPRPSCRRPTTSRRCSSTTAPRRWELRPRRTSPPPTRQGATAFTDTSTGGPTGWLWFFGEPSSPTNFSRERNPTHAYASSGTYTVDLIAGNFNGGSRVSKQVTATGGGGGGARAW